MSGIGIQQYLMAAVFCATKWYSWHPFCSYWLCLVVWNPLIGFVYNYALVIEPAKDRVQDLKGVCRYIFNHNQKTVTSRNLVHAFLSVFAQRFKFKSENFEAPDFKGEWNLQPLFLTSVALFVQASPAALHNIFLDLTTTSFFEFRSPNKSDRNCRDACQLAPSRFGNKILEEMFLCVFFLFVLHLQANKCALVLLK